MGELIFTGSDPAGNHAQICKAKDGFSVREQHGLKPFGVAFRLATDWLKSDWSNLA
jgi:hypothetical protein